MLKVHNISKFNDINIIYIHIFLVAKSNLYYNLVRLSLQNTFVEGWLVNGVKRNSFKKVLKKKDKKLIKFSLEELLQELGSHIKNKNTKWQLNKIPYYLLLNIRINSLRENEIWLLGWSKSTQYF